MTETLCTSGAVKLKAGAGVSSSLTADNYTQLINQAECFLNVSIKIPGVNIVSDFANMNSDVKKILEDAASSHAAMGAINYDTGGYTDAEAALMLNFNYTRLFDCVNLLKDKTATDFIRSFNT